MLRFVQSILYHLFCICFINESFSSELLQFLEGPILTVPARELYGIDSALLKTLMNQVQLSRIYLSDLELFLSRSRFVQIHVFRTLVIKDTRHVTKLIHNTQIHFVSKLFLNKECLMVRLRYFSIQVRVTMVCDKVQSKRHC